MEKILKILRDDTGSKLQKENEMVSKIRIDLQQVKNVNALKIVLITKDIQLEQRNQLIMFTGTSMVFEDHMLIDLKNKYSSQDLYRIGMIVNDCLKKFNE